MSILESPTTKPESILALCEYVWFTLVLNGVMRNLQEYTVVLRKRNNSVEGDYRIPLMVEVVVVIVVVGDEYQTTEYNIVSTQDRVRKRGSCTWLHMHQNDQSKNFACTYLASRQHNKVPLMAACDLIKF